MRPLFAFSAVVLSATMCSAAIKTSKVEYQHDGKTYIGTMSYDDATTAKRPGVLVCHEWWGLDDFAKGRAEELAKMGYVGFACDLYGGGKVVEHPKDAMAMTGVLRKDVPAWRGRAKAALDTLSKSELVDGTKLAAIGYCFGGTTAIQLALSGADLKAVATFHAGLPADVKPEDAKKVKGKILVANGAADTFIPAESVAAFSKAMKDAGVDAKVDNYPNAVHSFAVPSADAKKMDGMKYDPDADRKSWAAMSALFERTLGPVR